ncbi:uncharacterized protein C7orf31 [Xenopus laevis]|uniref:Uncharacterized protein C7orf31 n=2 Tax=Xenopus laevis TaxID=8355 RepID=A0A1L8FW28_XENLA|nr:uncharacterized protein C7orf31 [Xenopus laevis]OCT75784.1 hypothetical protein XELAEV_18030971mg [Xenopus laevis]
MAVQYDLPHYYRQREGAQCLVPSYQSSEILTPRQIPQRFTVSPGRYEEYLSKSSIPTRLPWGREREYGGIGPVCLPDNHRPKAEPPSLEAKGHKHYGYGGDPWPRGLPIEQYYDITQLRKSAVRASDDLYPKPPDVSINIKQIHTDFPAEHPYQSHISKFAVFPSYNPPEEPDGTFSPLHPETPSRGYDTIVLRKTSGNPYRHEIIDIREPKNPLIWPGQDGYFHFPKSNRGRKQIYYPMPPKTVAPNHFYKSQEEPLSERTDHLQRSLLKSQWITSYSRSFPDYSEMKRLNPGGFLDPGSIGQLGGSAEMILQSEPLEGRASCIQVSDNPTNAKEKVLNLLPKVQNIQTSPDLDGENDCGIPCYSKHHTFPACDTLSNHRSTRCHYSGEERKAHSARKRQFKEPELRKITDTDQSDALYSRQLMQASGLQEGNSEIKSIYDKELHPSEDEYTYSNLKKSLPENVAHDMTQESLNGWCTKQRVSQTPVPQELYDIKTEQQGPNLLELQSLFSRTKAYRDFHHNFPVSTMDLRDNSNSGKKHKFFGFNSFYFHN